MKLVVALLFSFCIFAYANSEAPLATKKPVFDWNEKLKKACPITIEDVSNNTVYRLETEGWVGISLPGGPDQTGGRWSVDGNKLIVSENGKEFLFNLKSNGKSFLIDESPHTAENEHRWMVNTPD